MSVRLRENNAPSASSSRDRGATPNGIPRRDAPARPGPGVLILNLVAPGAGLILLGRPRLGAALVLIFTACGQAALWSFLLLPDAVDRRLAVAALGVTGVTWLVAQYLYRASARPPGPQHGLRRELAGGQAVAAAIPDENRVSSPP
ncbi:MAG: hypothetical protein ACE5EX_01920 [Phycisphaerae bacterium]